MLKIGAKQNSHRPPENIFVSVMSFSEIGEERFFGHFVPSVHKAFGMYHLISAFNFVKAWAGGCILAVQTLILLFYRPRSCSGQPSTVCIGQLSDDINSNVSALSTRGWCSGENIEVTRIALADHAPHMLV